MAESYFAEYVRRCYRLPKAVNVTETILKAPANRGTYFPEPRPADQDVAAEQERRFRANAAAGKTQVLAAEPARQQEVTEGVKGGRQYKLYGHTVTAVIRWMGVNGWVFADARKALHGLGLPVADATIHAQLRGGRDGSRGDPAPLTPAQEAELDAHLGEK